MEDCFKVLVCNLSTCAHYRSAPVDGYPHHESVFLLLCTCSHLRLGARDCGFYTVGWWTFLRSRKYSWALFWDDLSSLETVCPFLVLLLWFVMRVQRSASSKTNSSPPLRKGPLSILPAALELCVLWGRPAGPELPGPGWVPCAVFLSLPWRLPSLWQSPHAPHWPVLCWALTPLGSGEWGSYILPVFPSLLGWGHFLFNWWK